MTRWITLASALIVAIGRGDLRLPDAPRAGPGADDRARTPGRGAAAEAGGRRREDPQVRHHARGRPKGSHTWGFKNVGQGPLEVWLEETTCSCTVATLKSARRASREQEDHDRAGPVVADRGGLGGAEVGPVRPGGHARHQRPGQPQRHACRSWARSSRRWRSSPSESITFPDGPPEERSAQTVDVVSNDRPDVEADQGHELAARPDRRRGQADGPRGVERLKVKSGYQLTVEVKPGMPTGRFSEELLIETDHPGPPVAEGGRGRAIRSGRSPWSRSRS